jgi:hypothetical protein
MITKYKFWMRAAAVLMLLTAVLHATSLFVEPTATNETERQLIDLITGYRRDLGSGFVRSFEDLFTALSACFSLLCLFGGLILGYAAGKITDRGALRGIVNISLAVFGICFALMVVYTFLPPIVCTGLIFLGLIGSRVALSSGET